MKNTGIRELEVGDTSWMTGRYQVIFENFSQAAAFFSSKDGKLTVYNHSFNQLTGYTKKELRGKTFQDFVHPDDLAVVNRRLRKLVLKKDTQAAFEIRVLNKQQNIYFVEVIALPHFENGELEGIEVFVRDITERKTYEKALVRQNNELKLLNAIAEVISETLSLEEILDSSLSVILKTLSYQTGLISIYDPTAKKFSRSFFCGEFDSELQKTLNGELNQLLFKMEAHTDWVLTFNSKNLHETFLNGMADFFKKKRYRSGAVVVLRSKEKIRGIMIILKRKLEYYSPEEQELLQSIGGQVGMALENSWLYEQTDLKLQARIQELAALNAISSAVSQTVELEERLKIILANLLQVMHLTQGGIYIVDDKQEEANLLVKQGLPKKYVQEIEKIELKEIQALLIPEKELIMDTQTMSSWYQLMKIGKSSCEIERVLTVFLRVKDKFLGFCNLVVAPERKITDDELRLLESVVHQIGVSIDNSKLYKEANIRQKQLQRMNKELENFIYLISHDLKTPVISIQGLIDIFLDELKQPLTQEENKYFKAIQECANRMESLIQNLLEFSRLGQVPLRPEEINLNELIDEIMNDFKFKIEQYKVKVTFPDDLPTLPVDRFRFKLAMANLIDNALKYSRQDVDSFLRIECREEHDRWLFTFADNGIGIAKIYYERVFNLFERLIRNPPGSGLGLAMVRRIVKMHGGSIWIDSKEGEGSRFFFTLPKE